MLQQRLLKYRNPQNGTSTAPTVSQLIQPPEPEDDDDNETAEWTDSMLRNNGSTFQLPTLEEEIENARNYIREAMFKHDSIAHICAMVASLRKRERITEFLLFNIQNNNAAIGAPESVPGIKLHHPGPVPETWKAYNTASKKCRNQMDRMSLLAEFCFKWMVDNKDNLKDDSRFNSEESMIFNSYHSLIAAMALHAIMVMRIRNKALVMSDLKTEFLPLFRKLYPQAISSLPLAFNVRSDLLDNFANWRDTKPAFNKALFGLLEAYVAYTKADNSKELCVLKEGCLHHLSYHGLMIYNYMLKISIVLNISFEEISDGLQQTGRCHDDIPGTLEDVIKAKHDLERNPMASITFPWCRYFDEQLYRTLSYNTSHWLALKLFAIRSVQSNVPIRTLIPAKTSVTDWMAGQLLRDADAFIRYCEASNDSDKASSH